MDSEKWDRIKKEVIKKLVEVFEEFVETFEQIKLPKGMNLVYYAVLKAEGDIFVDL